LTQINSIKIFIEKNKIFRKDQRLTNVLLQAGHDDVIFGFGSLSASVSAGQAMLGFCLLSFTFISLFSGGWGRPQQ